MQGQLLREGTNAELLVLLQALDASEGAVRREAIAMLEGASPALRAVLLALSDDAGEVRRRLRALAVEAVGAWTPRSRPAAPAQNDAGLPLAVAGAFVALENLAAHAARIGASDVSAQARDWTDRRRALLAELDVHVGD